MQLCSYAAMQRLTTGALTLTICLLQQVAKSQTDTERPPSPPLIKLHEDDTVRSLGVVRPNSDTTFVIPIANTGNETLQIRSVQVGCACTKAEFDKHELLPGESGRLIANIRAGNRDAIQSTSITLGLARAGFRDESHYAKFQVSALVRDECRWSHDSGSQIRLKATSPTKVMAANYGIRRWESVSAVVRSDKVKVNVQVIELSLDDDPRRQVAVLELSHTPGVSPFQESLTISLFSNNKDCAIRIGELFTNVELPHTVDIVPKLLTPADGVITASLIVNENGRVFDNEDIFATVGKEVLRPAAIRRVSGRWIEAKFNLPTGLMGKMDINFHSTVSGEVTIAPANLILP